MAIWIAKLFTVIGCRKDIKGDWFTKSQFSNGFSWLATLCSSKVFLTFDLIISNCFSVCYVFKRFIEMYPWKGNYENSFMKNMCDWLDLVVKDFFRRVSWALVFKTSSIDNFWPFCQTPVLSSEESLLNLQHHWSNNHHICRGYPDIGGVWTIDNNSNSLLSCYDVFRSNYRSFGTSRSASRDSDLITPVMPIHRVRCTSSSFLQVSNRSPPDECFINESRIDLLRWRSNM